MRRGRLVLALAAAATLTLAGCSSGDGDDDDTDAGATSEATEATGGAEGTIKIGIKFDQPGLGFQDGSEYTGFDVDVAKFVAGELGYGEDQIEWVQSPSAQRETLLQNGQVDMIFATYSITDKRKEVVSFAGPYFVAGQDLLVAADDDSITGPEDLEGKNLCSVTGSTSAQRIKDEYAAGHQPARAARVRRVRHRPDGRARSTPSRRTTSSSPASRPCPRTRARSRSSATRSPRRTTASASPRSSDKCEAINEAITKMIDDGTWQELLDKNVGASGYKANEELNPPTPAACA